MVSVGGLIAIVAMAQILHVGGAFGYRQYIQTNPEKASRCYHCKSGSKVPILRWTLVGLVFLSWVFSIAATAACTFLTMEQILTAEISYYYTDTIPFTTTFETSFGLRSIMGDKQECQRGSLQDDRFEAAYSFGVLNCLLTSIGFILLLLIQFKVFKTMNNNLQDSVWTALQWILYCSLWCCVFTFYVQESILCQIITEDSNNYFIPVEMISAMPLKDLQLPSDMTEELMAMSLEDLQLLFGSYVQLETSCSLGGAGGAQVFNVLLLVIICIMTVVAPQPSSLVHATHDDNENGRAEDHDHHTTTTTASETKNAGAKQTKSTTAGTKRTDKDQEDQSDESDESDESYESDGSYESVECD